MADKSSTLEALVTQGVDALTNQETINGVAVATALKTFLNLSDVQAAAGGVLYTLLKDHVNNKELGDGNSK